MNFFLIALSLLCFNAAAQEEELQRLHKALKGAGARFGVPALELSYEDNFAAIQDVTALGKQQRFFDSLSLVFYSVKPSREQSVLHKTIAFELPLHSERVRLSLLWKKEQAAAGPGGLFGFTRGKEWYVYFVKRFTGLDITPAEVFETGIKEVSRAREALHKIRERLGMSDDAELYAILSKDTQFVTDKKTMVSLFNRIDSTVRSNLTELFDVRQPAPIEAMEWQGAGASTPPGIYLSKRYNAYGVDVFQYNFFNGRFKRRSMEWLYLHEAIPGHHLQSDFFRNDEPFYFGTSEGWACYVETLGKRLGLYRDIYMELGAYEWDLVRSARLVMEVGIHYYGWSREKAMQYWRENIPGQDDIAGREITRVTSWPGQALCYKVGALAIQRIVEHRLSLGLSLRSAHRQVLLQSGLPLQALL